jgi:hypothetical protein
VFKANSPKGNWDFVGRFPATAERLNLIFGLVIQRTPYMSIYS